MPDSSASGSLRQMTLLPKAPIEIQYPDPSTATPKRKTTDTQRPSSQAMREQAVRDLEAVATEWVGVPGLHEHSAAFAQLRHNATRNRANTRRQPALS